jgi:hypothetical protein
LYCATPPYWYHALLLFQPATHVGSLAMVVSTLGLAMTWLGKNVDGRSGRVLPALYAFLVAAAVMSDLLFVVHLVVPLTMSLVVCACFRLFERRRLWRIAALTWVAAIAGYAAKRLLLSTAYPLPPRSAARSLLALRRLADGFGAALLRGDPRHLFCCACLVAAVVITVVLLGRGRSGNNAPGALERRQRLSVVFLVTWALSAVLGLAAPVMAAVSPLADFNMYDFAQKYALPFYILPLFVWPMILAPVIPAQRARWTQILRFASAVLAVVVPSCLLLAAPRQTHPLHGRISPFPLVRTLDEKAATYHLKYGVGGFWEVRRITLLSSTGLRVYPVDWDMSPFPTLTNLHWFRGYPGSRYPHPQYSFVLLNASGYAVPRNLVIQRFGPPAHEFLAGTTPVLVYNRPADQRFRDLFECNTMLRNLPGAPPGPADCPTQPPPTGVNNPLSSCDQEITSETRQLRLRPNETIRLSVAAKNTGHDVWESAGREPVVLSYVWYDSGKAVAQEGLRTLLPRPVWPGDTVRLEAQVKAPAQGVALTLKVTMVQEGVSWFLSNGGVPLEIPAVLY